VGDGSAPLDFGETPLAAHLTKRFKEDVDIVAFGGTHRTYNAVHDGVLFVNPGSPTLPMEAPGTVAVLDVSAKKPKVKLVSL
jgi:predicted phosphodiesterase